MSYYGIKFTTGDVWVQTVSETSGFSYTQNEELAAKFISAAEAQIALDKRNKCFPGLAQESVEIRIIPVTSVYDELEDHGLVNPLTSTKH